MDGKMVPTRSVTMTRAKDEQNHINSPNWCLARARSPASAVEFAGLEPQASIPESQLVLKNDVELIKAQLLAQTEAFQALSHSITLLEQESNYQQGRINALEEEVKFAAHLPHGEMFDELIQKKVQELWKTMTKEVEGLQNSMVQKQSSVENLSQDVLESKKFLWEELESVQAELRRIHQKLKDQEVDITRNLVSIKKMQENQMKYTKFLTKLRGKVPDEALEEKDHKPGPEELNEIWSAVNTLRNSIMNNSTWSEKRNSSRMKDRGSRQQPKTNLFDSNFSDSALHQHRRSSSKHSS
ncbi:PREDICTED: coiled-coil domain-containing protein 159 isoform X1 [Thamnophis sirtalis]|uniref:Coiled-coil domain-containing protein 159 isoform X1 n=1 Tax=Thamnophis sirtalis TaxID=35019 RepID=A0A6I9XW40_9SAUR|nr:PREDICTED: coiled-coil domain-containing protein 159 isoform X1 [Thamnophis sirtalis]